MERTQITDSVVEDFAKKLNYDIIKYKCQYGDWLAYIINAKDLIDSFYGYPKVVFIRSDMKCRFANLEEINEVMSIRFKDKK